MIVSLGKAVGSSRSGLEGKSLGAVILVEPVDKGRGSMAEVILLRRGNVPEELDAAEEFFSRPRRSLPNMTFADPARCNRRSVSKKRLLRAKICDRAAVRTTTKEGSLMASIESGYISADGHFVEPADLWTTRMEKRFRERAPRIESRADADWYYIDGVTPFPVGLEGASMEDKIAGEIKD